MSIFDLHAHVLADYRDFVRSFLSIADERAQEFVEHALVEEARLWPDFLLQVSPAYARTATVDELAAHGMLHEDTAHIFRTSEGNPFRLYQHQLEALEKARGGESYVVTSGTGSGKSLTYFLPIVDTLVRQPATGERVVALVVYPMNALVNSQLQALETLKEGYERRTGRAFPVTFAKFTGETNDTVREALRQRPPQILLTNYVMAELLLVRPEDQRFLDRAGGGLRFLIFDELHTYRGRQGADVAMLIRRLKERCTAPNLAHVGTSATMVANPDATPEMRRATVAYFATRLFGHPFTAGQVIEETLVTFTQGGLPTHEEVATAMTGPLPDRLEDFRRHPLARWAEGEFGVEPEEGGRLRRRVPCTLAQASERLAQSTGRGTDMCAARLREVLNRGGMLARDDGGRAFAFKLHQFIGHGCSAFSPQTKACWPPPASSPRHGSSGCSMKPPSASTGRSTAGGSCIARRRASCSRRKPPCCGRGGRMSKHRPPPANRKRCGSATSCCRSIPPARKATFIPTAISRARSSCRGTISRPCRCERGCRGTGGSSSPARASWPCASSLRGTSSIMKGLSGRS